MMYIWTLRKTFSFRTRAPWKWLTNSSRCPSLDLSLCSLSLLRHFYSLRASPWDLTNFPFLGISCTSFFAVVRHSPSPPIPAAPVRFTRSLSLLITRLPLTVRWSSQIRICAAGTLLFCMISDRLLPMDCTSMLLLSFSIDLSMLSV